MEFDFKELLRQAGQLQERIKEIQEQLSRKTVTADTGGGMVSVTVNGRQEIVSIRLDPQCVDPRDIPMLEDLILTAINQGMRRSRELAAEEMKQVTGGLPLPFPIT
ncbi:MAG TPA: YbaB/EbfC family nucleoid-associated protein [Deltaproteobacteria bacterium]|nr:YbaB/EbfC family nucleoid-associated protein [Deltaproteobacteria bacterium]HPR55499.1 YbaB/EbfC family nucleoid-associated protein [Deltaproteobacteria bacterium]HXK48628.1 YbaB/EbfC family nucleoid-associated protein [Deltaproteobacteria bacterium]